MADETKRRTFISYSRINKEFAVKLAKELRAADFPIWLDQLDIPTGARWDDELEKALRECGIFLVILTPAAIASENVKDEIGYAIDHGKRILPVLLQECDVPLRLRRFQYVDFTTKSYEDGVESAKQLLRNLAGEATGPIPVMPPAAETRTELGPAPTKKEPTAAKPAQKTSSPKPLMIGIGVVVGIGIIAGIILIALPSLGIFGGDRNSPPAVPTQVALPTDLPAPTKQVEQPTNAPEPTQKVVQHTNTLKPTVVPDTPTPGVQQYFTEEFNGDLTNWPIYIVDGKNDPVITNKQFDDVNLSAEDGWYLFDIGRRQIWAYSIYDPFEYEDVRVDARTDNQGVDANNVSLICRYSAERGWYEFKIANNGLYDIYYAKANASGSVSYRTIADGGSTKVKSGNAINEYSIICQGNTLSLYINGDLAKKTSDDLSTLRTGKIGVSVSSFNVLPVNVRFDWVKISKP